MTTPPPPFTTPEIDVRDFDGFMLNTERLMASELVALSTGEEFKAAVLLWCRAWKQIPAGSLPNDERVLAAFSGARERWPQVREMALRGFVLCSDGRLYHAHLCREALLAHAKKAGFAEHREAEAARKKAERDRRAAMFKVLRDNNVFPPWNTSTHDLSHLVTHLSRGQELLASILKSNGKILDGAPPVTAGHAPRTAIQGQGQGQGQKKVELNPDRGVGARRAKARSDPHTPRVSASRWPADAVVPEDWRQAAGMKRAELGLPTIDLDLEAESFANFWAAKSGQNATKVDWRKTWINWTLKAEPRNGRSKSNAHENFARGAFLAARDREQGGGG